MERSQIESTSPAVVASERPQHSQRGRRGWRQFSLLSLLLLFVIACLIAGYVGQMRRMEDARRELARRDMTIQRLRRDLGLDEDVNSALDVQDPTKLHAAALPDWDENEWRWKVYLPPGKTWRMRLEIFESAGGGKPLILVGGGGSQIGDDGELVLQTRLHRDLDGMVRISSRIGRSGNSHGSSYLDAQVKRKDSVSVTQAGNRKQAIGEPGKPLELLRRTVMGEPQPIPGTNRTVAYQAGAVVLSLEEVPPATAK
jgi:hypothetical protein